MSESVTRDDGQVLKQETGTETEMKPAEEPATKGDLVRFEHAISEASGDCSKEIVDSVADEMEKGIKDTRMDILNTLRSKYTKSLEQAQVSPQPIPSPLSNLYACCN